MIFKKFIELLKEKSDNIKKKRDGVNYNLNNIYMVLDKIYYIPKIRIIIKDNYFDVVFKVEKKYNQYYILAYERKIKIENKHISDSDFNFLLEKEFYKFNFILLDYFIAEE